MATETIQNVWATEGNNPDAPSILNSSDQYPAKDGSLITNISADNIDGLQSKLADSSFSSGVYFTATDGVGVLDNSETLTSGTVTRSFKFRVDDLSSSRTFYAKTISGNRIGIGYFVNNNAFGCRLRVGSTDYVSGSFVPVLGQTYHVTGVFDIDSTTATLYVNGELVSGGASPTVTTSNTVGETLGRSTTGTAAIVGSISEYYQAGEGLSSAQALELSKIGPEAFAAKNPSISTECILSDAPAGLQWVDKTDNNKDALLSETDAIPFNADYEGLLRLEDVDLTVTSFLFGDRDVLYNNSYIVGIILDGQLVGMTDENTQDLAKRELRWDSTTNTLQRSDGATHEDVQACPAGTASSDIIILIKKG